MELADSFGGQDFTWQVVTAGADGGESSTTTTSSDSGYSY